MEILYDTTQLILAKNLTGTFHIDIVCSSVIPDFGNFPVVL